ncbi:MAG: hypothetical protein PHU85_10140 [Phycisphaerae bacterium]|nr:hypothetical protein [Phycisphaerae bacterium]
MTLDLQPFVRWIVDRFEPACRVGGIVGRYARKPGEETLGLYGVADVACVLHTIGELHPSDSERAAWRESFYELSDPQTGYIIERPPRHGRLHNTAFALGAMNLLGILPRAPLAFARDYATQDALAAFLARLDWAAGVYRDSHDGAGLASCMALAPGTVAPQWFGWYFSLADALFDPRNGLMGRGKPAGGDIDQIGGTFHYAFVYEHFRRRMPHGPQRIDAVLGLQLPAGDWDPQNNSWLTLDGLYLLTRSVRHCHHRPDDVRSAVRRIASTCYERVMDNGWRQREFVEHTVGAHMLTAAVSILAECQQFLSLDEIATDYPLQLVLDRRPFI